MNMRMIQFLISIIIIMEYKHNETGKQSLLINEDYEVRNNSNEINPSTTLEQPASPAEPIT